MLQFYDKIWSISVLAFAALATPMAATADSADPVVEPGCDLADGYGETLANYVAEAQACLDAPQSAALSEKARDTRLLMQRIREKNGAGALGEHPALDAAARMHALDMAARGYAAHADPEGRGHEERLRAIGRDLIFGAAGANITVVDRGATAVDIYNALIGDEISRENLFRSEFTHGGFGLAERDGRLYAVQVFAQVDGALRQPLPVDLPIVSDIPVEFVDAGFETEGWRIETAGGDIVTRGLAPRLYRARLAGADGYLTVEARQGTAVYALKGPAVSAR